MSYELQCKVSVGNFVFNYLNEFTYESTWKELGVKAILKLPNLARFEGTGIFLENKLRTGMPIKVELGYKETDLNVEFEGYISEIIPKTPYELVLEDEFYTLKKSNKITKSYPKVSVKNLLKELVPEVILDKNSPDITIDNFLIRNATKAEVLQELKEKYLLTMYYRGKDLYVGLPYFEKITQKPEERNVYHFQRNIIESNLVYKSKEDIKLKIKAISIQKDGSKIEAEAGDKDGQERTLNYQNISDKNVLKKIAESDLEKYKYDGYQGSFLSFGYPFTQQGESVEILDSKYNRAGAYLVDKVNVSFGPAGFRREIELGKKV